MQDITDEFSPPHYPPKHREIPLAVSQTVSSSPTTSQRTNSTQINLGPETKAIDPLVINSPLADVPHQSAHKYSHTMHDFNIIGAKTELPQLGWRKNLTKVGIKIKKSPQEITYDRQVQKINKFLRKPVVIGILSFKGGVGKTTIGVCTGSTFADLRTVGGSVVGLDMDHFGSIATRISHTDPINNTRTFLADSQLNGPSDTTAHQLCNSHRFHVLASDPHPGALPLGGKEYNHMLNFLLRDNCLVIVDGGTSAASPALPTIVNSLHALIVVSSAAVDGALGGWKVLSWLNHYGFHDLLGRTILVVSRTSAEKKLKIDLNKLEKRFSIEQHIPVFHVPYDSHLAEAGVINLSLLHPRTRRIFVDISATIAEKLRD